MFQLQGNISLADVHTVVMDEADTLFDHSFSEMTEKLVHSIQYVSVLDFRPLPYFFILQLLIKFYHAQISYVQSQEGS